TGQVVISIGGKFPEEARNALLAAYKAVRPTVEVIWEAPDLSGSDYGTWLGTQLAAGAVKLDIVSGNYVDSYRNYLDFDKYRKLTNPHTGNPWDQDLDFDFFVERNVQGKRYMIATRAVHQYWFYNVELFEKAGVKPPKNWSELAEICAKIKDMGIAPIAASHLTSWMVCVYFDPYHIHWIEKVRAQKGDWIYASILILTGGGPGYTTYVPGLQMYKQLSYGNIGYASAIGVLLFIIIFAGTVFMMRYRRQQTDLW
ncbi:MAG: extracellular solute-binding protein, partial [Desulfomonilaceae bacterium]